MLPPLLWLVIHGIAMGQFLEVKEMPYHLSDRLEGAYSQWNARWFNGPVYRRMEAIWNSKVKMPVFLGQLCASVKGGHKATLWCFLQCDEEVLMRTGALLLPCDVPYPDGADCHPENVPSTPSSMLQQQTSTTTTTATTTTTLAHGPEQQPASSQPPQPPPVCEVLGHARRWYDAGRVDAGLPSPEWWRLQDRDGRFVDARAASPGQFMVVPRVAQVMAPGERLSFRRDGTLRPVSRPSFCVGANVLAEGTPLVFDECSWPPHPNELFSSLSGASEHGEVVHSMTKPALCAVASRPVDQGDGDRQGFAVVRLGRCDGLRSEAPPLRLFEANDGTVRLSATPWRCLQSGLDRPRPGSELIVGHCFQAQSDGTIGDFKASHTEANEEVITRESRLIAAMESLSRALEDKFERLERKVDQLWNEDFETNVAAVGNLAGASARLTQIEHQLASLMPVVARHATTNRSREASRSAPTFSSSTHSATASEVTFNGAACTNESCPSRAASSLSTPLGLHPRSYVPSAEL